MPLLLYDACKISLVRISRTIASVCYSVKMETKYYIIKQD